MPLCARSEASLSLTTVITPTSSSARTRLNIPNCRTTNSGRTNGVSVPSVSLCRTDMWILHLGYGLLSTPDHLKQKCLLCSSESERPTAEEEVEFPQIEWRRLERFGDLGPGEEFQQGHHLKGQLTSGQEVSKGKQKPHFLFLSVHCETVLTFRRKRHRVDRRLRDDCMYLFNRRWRRDTAPECGVKTYPGRSRPSSKCCTSSWRIGKRPSKEYHPWDSSSVSFTQNCVCSFPFSSKRKASDKADWSSEPPLHCLPNGLFQWTCTRSTQCLRSWEGTTRCVRRSCGKDFTTNWEGTRVTRAQPPAPGDTTKGKWNHHSFYLQPEFESHEYQVQRHLCRLLLPFERSKKGQEFKFSEKDKKKGRSPDMKKGQCRQLLCLSNQMPVLMIYGERKNPVVSFFQFQMVKERIL